jgi:hypothetical protein
LSIVTTTTNNNADLSLLLWNNVKFLRLVALVSGAAELEKGHDAR